MPNTTTYDGVSHLLSRFNTSQEITELSLKDIFSKILTNRLVVVTLMQDGPLKSKTGCAKTSDMLPEQGKYCLRSRDCLFPSDPVYALTRVSNIF